MKDNRANEAEVLYIRASESGSGSLLDRASRRYSPLDSAALRASARRRTGLEDFGHPPIEPALSTLVNSLEEEADLHPLGRFLMRGHLLEILETRLRLTRAWSGRSEAAATSPIRRPVFIAGIPRSGSTFLHELLAQDPDNRSPRVWEVMFPLPAPDPGAADRDPRVRKAAARLWFFRRLVPQADGVYPLRAGTPHECVAMHSFTLLSEEFISSCRVPTYEAYLRSVGLRPAYEWQQRFLQHLQSRCPTRRWVLKTPHHLHALEELFAVFPDAVVIQTHRNPADVLASNIQLAAALQGLYARREDPDRLRERETRMLAEKIEGSMRFRDLHPELAGRFVDINYAEMIRDPIAAVRRIYERLDCPLSDLAAERMHRMAAGRARYRRRHEARPAEPRLDINRESDCFRAYCSRFEIACGQPAAL